MPMSTSFQDRLFPALPQITKHFPTPFHIYDEVGIREGIKYLRELFAWNSGFREFFAVKALPNLEILKILLAEGCGFDCSSIPELIMARQVGASPEQIMFTSNNTARAEYEAAAAEGGCILNLDDITFVRKVPEPFPELICFRYNPGKTREGNAIIGKPEEAKYGIRADQFEAAYRLAIKAGAKRFGIHTMLVSNELNYQYMVETVRMLLELVVAARDLLKINVEFINVGGGIGIPYQPDQKPFDLENLSIRASEIFRAGKLLASQRPALYMESGRWVTGPHGVLVTSVINRTHKYHNNLGADACMSSLMRPAMYDAYHHITILNQFGEPIEGAVEQIDVVGSLCENNDKFAKQRWLPVSREGDIIVIHDTGAHGIAMGFQYNGRLLPAELLLCEDGTVKLIRRAETVEDYLRTQMDLEPDVLKL